MPYSNVPKDLWAKMDRCTEAVSGTNKRTGKPYTKAQKVAICYSRVVGTRPENSLSGEPLSTFALDADGDGIVTIVAAEDGSPVYMKTPDGVRVVTWRPGTLRKIAKTWIGTKNGVNHYHDPALDADIKDAFTMEVDGKEKLILRVAVKPEMKGFLDQLMPDVFTSVEATVKELVGDEIADAVGSGNTFVVAPMEPACSPDNCYVVGYKMSEIMPTPDEDEGCCGESIEFEMDQADFAALLWRQPGPYWDESLQKLSQAGGDSQIGDIAIGAMLTAKTRKALPDSAFCGPDRSFPAHDAAHARNGLARLSNSNFSPAVKARIKACLVRRAQKHGVKVEAADEAHGADDLTDCAAGHLYEAVSCFKNRGIDCDSADFSVYGHKGDIPWEAHFKYYRPPEVSGMNTITASTIALNTTSNTNGIITSIFTSTDGKWTVVGATPDGNQKPQAEAEIMAEDNEKVIAGLKAELDTLKAEKAAAAAGNQKPSAESTNMSEEQTIVELKSEVEKLRKDLDEAKAFRSDRLRQERYTELLELKKLGVDVTNFEPFDLDQLRTIAAGVKAGKVQHSGAVATKPRTDSLPRIREDANVAHLVAGAKEPDMTEDEIQAVRNYEKQLLGMPEAIPDPVAVATMRAAIAAARNG